MIAHCPNTETHFLPRLSRPRRHRPTSGKAKNRAHASTAHGRDKIRQCAHSLALFLRLCRCVCSSCRRGKRKAAAVGTMLSAGSQEEGVDPSHRFRPQPPLLSQNPASSTCSLLRCGGPGPFLFKVSWSRKNVLSISGMIPKGMEFKRGD